MAIDLRLDATGVGEMCDFVSEEHGGCANAPEGLVDVVVLSLVANFVPGDMLRQEASLLRPRGPFFLALPLVCVENSR